MIACPNNCAPSLLCVGEEVETTTEFSYTVSTRCEGCDSQGSATFFYSNARDVEWHYDSDESDDPIGIPELET